MCCFVCRNFSEDLIKTIRKPITCRAPDKVHISISIMPISSPNPMFDHLLESSHRDDSNKWLNIGFGEDVTQVESIEVNLTHFIWYSKHESCFSDCRLFRFKPTCRQDCQKNCLFNSNLMSENIMPRFA